MREIDDISGDVVDLALRLHRDLGPGLLESVYEMIMASKLAEMGYSVARQRPIDIEFEGTRFDAAFRIDLLVDERLIVEVKSVEQLAKVHAKQVLTYIRLTKQPVGLLINFGGETLKEGGVASSTIINPPRSPRLCAKSIFPGVSNVRPDRHDRAGDRRERGDRFGDRAGAGGAGRAAGGVGVQRG